MTVERIKEMGRLAMRVEGDWWAAYYAEADTMEGALWLGSIRLKLVERRDRRAAFLALMRDVVADLIEEVAGRRPDWIDERTAPDHERAERD
jgi:hypothetical protein